MTRIPAPETKQFDRPDSLAAALASRIARELQKGIDARGSASLVVSGGSTPIPLFHALCRQPIDWQEVFVTLADERWLPSSHPDSNERLVREHLLIDKAATAKFKGLHNMFDTPEAGAALTGKKLASVPRPFDVVVLGMGNDGHTASLFPCAAQLQHGLNTREVCLAVHPTRAPHPRLSLSLHSLLTARQIYLHLSGEGKQQVLQRALADPDPMVMPIRAVLGQRSTPVDVYWSSA